VRNDPGTLVASQGDPILIEFSARPRRSQAQMVRQVCERLEESYGRPRLGNPRRPLDDLLFILMSNRTAPKVAIATYRSLKERFPRWDVLAEARVADIERVLRPAGLALKKARQLSGIAKRLREDFGRVTLSPLRCLPDADVLAYLRRLPGVSTKVAYCVMMYTMDREVLPVDVHVHKICSRLGWISKKRADQSHEVLAMLVPSHRRFAFHVGCIALGRKVCTPSKPNHHRCPIRKYCEHAAREHEEKERRQAPGR